MNKDEAAMMMFCGFWAVAFFVLAGAQYVLRSTLRYIRGKYVSKDR